MKLKTISFIVLVLIAIVGGFVVLRNCSDSCADDAFVVGTVSGYAPFVSINEDGEYVGFDIDVAQALADRLGKKLVINDLGSMTSLFIALEQGKIDAIIWGLSITQERLNKVAMICYQGEAVVTYPLMFWKRIPDGVTSIEDMQGRTVCVEPASSQDAVLSNYSFIQKNPTEKVDDALLAIQYGKADAAFVEPAIAKKFKNKCSDIVILDVPLAPKDQVQGIGIAINRKNIDLTERVKCAVSALQDASTIKMYEEKWGIA